MPLLTVILYALLITPVVIYARLDAGEEITMQARVRFWRFAFGFDAVVREGREGRYVAFREKRGERESGEIDVGIRPAARLFLKNARARRYLLSHVQLRELTVRLRVGTGDAAYTAWLCGALMALLFPLSRRMERTQGVRPTLDVRCEWNREVFVGSAQGIIVVLPGDIMAALLLAGARKLRNEARRRWTGTPLKA